MNEIQIFARKNEGEKLKEAIAQASELKPKNPKILQLQFNMAIAEKDYTTAENVLNTIREVNADNAHGEIFQAKLQAAQGELNLAEATYRRTLMNQDINTDGWTEYAYILLSNSKLNEAEDAFKKALTQKPDNTKAIKGLTRVYLATNRGKDALKLVSDSKKFASKDADLIDLYLQLEQKFW